MIISHQSSFSQGLCAILQDIVPPASVYLTALLMMLMQIPEKLMLSCSDYTTVIIKEVFKACIIYGFRVDIKF